MKVLVDTNIVLDIILERQPFAEQASLLLQCDLCHLCHLCHLCPISDLGCHSLSSSYQWIEVY